MTSSVLPESSQPHKTDTALLQMKSQDIRHVGTQTPDSSLEFCPCSSLSPEGSQEARGMRALPLGSEGKRKEGVRGGGQEERGEGREQEKLSHSSRGRPPWRIQGQKKGRG